MPPRIAAVRAGRIVLRVTTESGRRFVVRERRVASPLLPRVELLCLEFAPPPGTVVGDYLFEHGCEGSQVGGLSLSERNGSRCLVGLSGGDDPFWVGDDAAVVEEEVDVVLGRKEGADVSLEDEVGLHRALDRLADLWVGAVDQVAELLAGVLLPVW